MKMSRLVVERVIWRELCLRFCIKALVFICDPLCKKWPHSTGE